MNKWITTGLLVLALFSCREDATTEQKEKSAEPEKIAIVEELKKQVSQHPDSVRTRMQLVNVLDSLGMYAEAIANIDSMIKRDSINNGLWLTKAQLHESAKDTATAIQSYERAIAVYNSVDAQLSLANLYAETKNPMALKICDAVRNLRAGREVDAHCDFISGIYYSRIGNSKNALELFDRCINNIWEQIFKK